MERVEPRPARAAALVILARRRDASGDVIEVALGVFRGDVKMTASNFVYADLRHASD